jgi:hypothetical protein
MSEPAKLPDPSMVEERISGQVITEISRVGPDPVALIAQAIAGVMADIGVVGKSGENKFQNYKYAKMESILQRLTPLLSKHGLVIIQTEVDRGMFDDERVLAIKYQFTIVHISGAIWPDRPIQTGMSRCRDSKGGFDDKSMNKCHTAARKYFLLALFQIPTGDVDDADAADGEVKTTGYIETSITPAQIVALSDRIAQVEADPVLFCQYLGVDTLANIPASRFQEALDALALKARRASK